MIKCFIYVINADMIPDSKSPDKGSFSASCMFLSIRFSNPSFCGIESSFLMTAATSLSLSDMTHNTPPYSEVGKGIQ